MGDPVTGGLMAVGGLTSFLGAKEQAKAAERAAQPLPTYAMPYQMPTEKAMWPGVSGQLGNIFAGSAYDVPTYSVPEMPMPTEETLAGIPAEVKEGWMLPLTESLSRAREVLGGTGGFTETGEPAGAAARVLGEMSAKYAPTMLAKGYGLTQPAMMQQWAAEAQQAKDMWAAELRKAQLPSQLAAALFPQVKGETLVGHTPTIQEIQPGVPMPPDYQTQLANLSTQTQQGKTRIMTPGGVVWR